MFLAEGIFPIGMPLHDPSRSCLPLVRVWPEQKLMKLAASMLCVSLVSSQPAGEAVLGD